MESETNNIMMQVCSQTKLIEKQKQLKADLGSFQAQKILSVSATPHIIDKKNDANKIEVSGYIFYNVLYLDAEANCVAYDYTADFAEQLDLLGVQPDTHILASADLIDVEPKTTNDSLSVTTTINLKATAIFSENIECVDLDNIDANICTQLDTTPTMSIVNSGTQNFEVGNRVDLGKNFSNIINTSATLTSVDYFCENETLIANGQLTTNILYATTDEMHPIMSKSIIYDFKHEITCDNATTDTNILAELMLLQDKIGVEFDEDNDEIMLTYPLSIDYVVLEKKDVKIILDAYCTDKEINITSQSQECLDILPLTKFEEQIHTNLVLDKDYQSIEKIIGYNADNVVITKALAEKDAINFEGIAYANILYVSYDQNEEQKSNASIIAEMPFSFKLDYSGLQEGDEIILRARLADFDSRVKRAQELDAFAQLKVQAYAVKKKVASFTTRLDYGEEKTLNTAGLSIYLMNKGASAWDVAKKLSITQTQLCEQNPNLSFPLEQNEKIVLYRQLTN